MRRLMLLAMVFGSTAWAAEPYKIVIVTDPGAKKLAYESIRTIRSMPPFNRMGGQLAFEIIEGEAEKLACKSGCRGLKMLLCCNKDYALELGASRGAHKVMITTSDARGGTGGTVAIAGKGSPSSMLLHELLHTYGLDDEYEYTGKEIDEYCNPPDRAPNTVVLNPLPAYRSDAHAREVHGGEIPWFGKIEPTTLITTGSALGTTPGVFPADRAGLYRGGACNQKVPTFKPYYEYTIMGSQFAVSVPPVHAEAVLKQMSAELGREIVLGAKIDAGRDARVTESQAKELQKELGPGSESRGASGGAAAR